MLVLMRSRGQRIFIGDDIVISIEGVNRDGIVRVGIEAPRDVLILREELLDGPRRDGDHLEKLEDRHD